ncbi:Oligopeptide transporter 3 [Capsicum annuum]|nr:Oligopeptide transporter 3 [Capsicum annuum]
MAATLPKNNFALFGRWGSFSLNPGPFNIKEHVVITVMANCGVSIGGGDAYSIGAITVMRAYYKQSVGFLCSLIIVLDYTASGHKYDTTKIFTPQFHLNISAYEKYSKLYLSPLFALSIGSGFAWFTATLTHVVLFQGSDIWKQSSSVVKNVKMDIHAKLMKSYKQVPQWWFLVLLVGSVALSLLMCFVWKKDVQLPWWGMLFAFGLAFILTLPIGVIQATTNQQPGYDIIAQFIIGYILPGKPIANLLFKIYDRTRTLVAGTINLAVAWWMLGSIENICDVETLHPDSPWTCPKFRVTFDASVIWGLIGPQRLFGPGGLYRNLVWLFLIGALLPVPIWVLSKIFPEKKWIPLINIPVVSYGFAGMPPATPTNIASWLITGMIFNYSVFKHRKEWWKKYN